MHTARITTAQLGDTGLQISRMGCGAWAIARGDYLVLCTAQGLVHEDLLCRR